MNNENNSADTTVNLIKEVDNANLFSNDEIAKNSVIGKNTIYLHPMERI